jgi:hypothetical protein
MFDKLTAQRSLKLAKQMKIVYMQGYENGYSGRRSPNRTSR